jgi:hypothetical protein
MVREAFVVAMLVLWQALIVYAQLDPRAAGRRAGRWKLRALAPAWDLFIGRQVTWVLAYRDRSAEGIVGDWQPLPMRATRRGFAVFWNPDFWPVGAVLSLAHKIVRQARACPDESALAARFPHRALRRWIATRARDPDAVERQFRIERSGGFVASFPSEIAYVSEFYPL